MFLFFLIIVFCFIMFVVAMKRSLKTANTIANETANKPAHNGTLVKTKTYSIVGVHYSHFGNHSQEALQDLTVGEPLFLYADTKNKYDEYAVVIKDWEDKYVGWLPSGSSEVYNALIENSDNVTAELTEKYALFDEDDNPKMYKGEVMCGENIKVDIYK